MCILVPFRFRICHNNVDRQSHIIYKILRKKEQKHICKNGFRLAIILIGETQIVCYLIVRAFPNSPLID